MIEIDRSKCKKMFVWDDASKESNYRERIVIFFTGDEYITVIKEDEDSFINGGDYETSTYDNAKPLPEPKPMTALDVMWWESKELLRGCLIVNKRKGCKEFDNIIEFDGIDSILEDYEWNELIRENGETKLKYAEWKPFNFDECDMGE
jgi:hypothetical protein